jgi:hypothetical protein
MSKADTTLPADLAHDAVTGELVPVAEWLGVLPMTQETDDAIENIVAQILASEDIDSLLTPNVAKKLSDYAGKNIVINDVRLARSNIKDNRLGAFAIMDITVTSTGENVVAISGATNVLAQLVVAFQKGYLPMACRMVETVSKSNAERSIQWLVQTESF